MNRGTKNATPTCEQESSKPTRFADDISQSDSNTPTTSTPNEGQKLEMEGSVWENPSMQCLDLHLAPCAAADYVGRALDSFFTEMIQKMDEERKYPYLSVFADKPGPVDPEIRIVTWFREQKERSSFQTVGFLSNYANLLTNLSFRMVRTSQKCGMKFHRHFGDLQTVIEWIGEEADQAVRIALWVVFGAILAIQTVIETPFTTEVSFLKKEDDAVPLFMNLAAEASRLNSQVPQFKFQRELMNYMRAMRSTEYMWALSHRDHKVRCAWVQNAAQELSKLCSVITDPYLVPDILLRASIDRETKEEYEERIREEFLKEDKRQAGWFMTTLAFLHFLFISHSKTFFAYRSAGILSALSAGVGMIFGFPIILGGGIMCLTFTLASTYIYYKWDAKRILERVTSTSVKHVRYYLQGKYIAWFTLFSVITSVCVFWFFSRYFKDKKDREKLKKELGVPEGDVPWKKQGKTTKSDSMAQWVSFIAKPVLDSMGYLAQHARSVIALVDCVGRMKLVMTWLRGAYENYLDPDARLDEQMGMLFIYGDNLAGILVYDGDLAKLRATGFVLCTLRSADLPAKKGVVWHKVRDGAAYGKADLDYALFSPKRYGQTSGKLPDFFFDKLDRVRHTFDIGTPHLDTYCVNSKGELQLLRTVGGNVSEEATNLLAEKLIKAQAKTHTQAFAKGKMVDAAKPDASKTLPLSKKAILKAYKAGKLHGDAAMLKAYKKKQAEKYAAPTPSSDSDAEPAVESVEEDEEEEDDGAGVGFKTIDIKGKKKETEDDISASSPDLGVDARDELPEHMKFGATYQKHMRPSTPSTSQNHLTPAPQKHNGGAVLAGSMMESKEIQTIPLTDAQKRSWRMRKEGMFLTNAIVASESTWHTSLNWSKSMVQQLVQKRFGAKMFPVYTPLPVRSTTGDAFVSVDVSHLYGEKLKGLGRANTRIEAEKLAALDLYEQLVEYNMMYPILLSSDVVVTVAELYAKLFKKTIIFKYEGNFESGVFRATVDLLDSYVCVAAGTKKMARQLLCCKLLPFLKKIEDGKGKYQTLEHLEITSDDFRVVATKRDMLKMVREGYKKETGQEPDVAIVRTRDVGETRSAEEIVSIRSGSKWENPVPVNVSEAYKDYLADTVERPPAEPTGPNTSAAHMASSKEAVAAIDSTEFVESQRLAVNMIDRATEMLHAEEWDKFRPWDPCEVWHDRTWMIALDEWQLVAILAMVRAVPRTEQARLWLRSICADMVNEYSRMPKEALIREKKVIPVEKSWHKHGLENDKEKEDVRAVEKQSVYAAGAAFGRRTKEIIVEYSTKAWFTSQPYKWWILGTLLSLAVVIVIISYYRSNQKYRKDLKARRRADGDKVLTDLQRIERERAVAADVAKLQQEQRAREAAYTPQEKAAQAESVAARRWWESKITVYPESKCFERHAGDWHTLLYGGVDESAEGTPFKSADIAVWQLPEGSWVQWRGVQAAARRIGPVVGNSPYKLKYNDKYGHPHEVTVRAAGNVLPESRYEKQAASMGVAIPVDVRNQLRSMEKSRRRTGERIRAVVTKLPEPIARNVLLDTSHEFATHVAELPDTAGGHYLDPNEEEQEDEVVVSTDGKVLKRGLRAQQVLYAAPVDAFEKDILMSAAPATKAIQMRDKATFGKEALNGQSFLVKGVWCMPKHFHKMGEIYASSDKGRSAMIDLPAHLADPANEHVVVNDSDTVAKGSNLDLILVRPPQCLNGFDRFTTIGPDLKLGEGRTGWLVGKHPLKEGPSIQGPFTYFKSEEDGCYWYQAESWPGLCGAQLWDDKYQALMGIHTGIHPKQGVCRAEPLTGYVKDLIDQKTLEWQRNPNVGDPGVLRPTNHDRQGFQNSSPSKSQ